VLQCGESSSHVLISDFDHNIFNSFIAFYIFLSIPQYVLQNKNCQSEDDINGQSTFFCKQMNTVVFYLDFLRKSINLFVQLTGPSIDRENIYSYDSHNFYVISLFK
jgi:hypothetical protein